MNHQASQYICSIKPVFILNLIAFVVLTGCAQRESAETSQFVNWVAEHALQMENPESSLSESSLKGFREMIGATRVVGIGESRHDTREQLYLKAVLVRHLIEDLGFRALIIEESCPHVFPLDQYVLVGEGDLRKIMNGLAGWYLWDTEEMIELIEWIRQYNIGLKPELRVRIFGMDVTAPAPGVRSALEMMEAVGFEAGLDGQQLGLDLQEGDFWPGTWERYSRLSDSRRDELHENYNRLIEAMTEAKAKLIAASARNKFEQGLLMAEVGKLGNEFFSSADRMQGGVVRENGMAKTARWYLDNVIPGERAIVWAHNLHVATSTFQMPELLAGTLEPMGMQMRTEFGDAYIAIGGAFGEGSYPENLPPGHRDFEKLSADIMDGALANAGPATFLIDLRIAEKNPAAKIWLQKEREWRAQDARALIIPGAAFDIVYYVSNVTRAQPTPLALQRFESQR